MGLAGYWFDPGIRASGYDSRVIRAEVLDARSGKMLAIWEPDGEPALDYIDISPDGRYLFGSSYYTGISNIFRYEIATGDIEAVSNAETGFFRPTPMPDGRLLVFEYTGQGFKPTIIDAVPVEDLSLVQRYAKTGTVEPQISKLGTPAWDKTKERTKKAIEKVVFGK